MRPSHTVYLLFFAITTALTAQSEPSLSVEETPKHIQLKSGNKKLLSYNKSLQIAPKGIDPINNRSGYIHPIFTPSGKVASGDFSEDHPHQHGLFMAWTNSRYRGKKIDFWNPKEKSGRVEYAETISLRADSEQAAFSVRHRHIATAFDSEVHVIDETWTVTARQASKRAYIFDVESVQSIVGNDPLTLVEYRYGGMALRASNEWTSTPSNPDGTCDFLTSEGDAREAGNHTKIRWARMSGIIDDQPLSITVLDHPKNFRSPQTARLHPKMPYFVFSPMVEGEFQIEPGQEYVSRYRYLVTDDVADPKWIDQRWKDFANAEID